MDPILHSTGDFYPVPEITDPSDSTDEELMLCFNRSPSGERGRLEDLSRRCPEQLPSVFLAGRKSFPSQGWQTDHGRWEPKKVTSVGNMLGVKTTLEFKPKNGTIKFDKIQMAIYSTFFCYRDGLFFHEDFSVCCVFRKGKGPKPAHATWEGFLPPPLHEWKEEIRTNFDATNCCPLGLEDYGVGGSNKRQRGAGSPLWEGYTKIYTKDPDRMYAACNHCTTMLKIKPGDGTGSLRNHNKSCPFKNLSMGNSMNTTSIALGIGTSESMNTPSIALGIIGISGAVNAPYE